MFKKNMKLTCLFSLSLSSQIFTSDKEFVGEGERGRTIEASWPNLNTSRIKSYIMQVSTRDGQKIDFLPSDYLEEHIKEYWDQQVRSILLEKLKKETGYDGEATSPRSAVIETLVRIQQLKSELAPAPTSGGASAAGE